jgi:hypothetical protein
VTVPEDLTPNGGRVETPPEVPTVENRPSGDGPSLLERISDVITSLPDSTWGDHLEPSGTEFFKGQKSSKRRKRSSKKGKHSTNVPEQSTEGCAEDKEVEPDSVVNWSDEAVATAMEQKYINYPPEEAEMDSRMNVDESERFVEAEDLEMGPR